MSAKLGYATNPELLQHSLEPGHPESPHRIKAIQRQIENSDLFEKLELLQALNVSVDDLKRVHPESHIQSIQNSDTIHPHAELAVGLSLSAAHSVATGQCHYAFCNIRPPGHHSYLGGADYDGPNQGQGFCFYNNVAIVARKLQHDYGIKRILIVDWDYHHGNGTESVFYDDDSVLFFSTHDLYNYPGTGDPNRNGEGAGEGYNINVALPPGAGDKDIITVFNKELVPVASEFKPDFILISAGFDSRMNDPLGSFNITDKGFAELTKILMNLAANHCPGKIVSILEGGYNPEGIAKAVEAHLRTFIEK